MGGIIQQASHKVVADPVRLVRPHHISETESTHSQSEHGGVGREERLAGKLACSIGRDWDERSVILGHLMLTEIAIHTAAGGVPDSLHAPTAGSFSNMMREQGALIEVNGRFGGSTCDIRVGCQMHHGVVTIHLSLIHISEPT